jgi:hypothetical protein
MGVYCEVSSAHHDAFAAALPLSHLHGTTLPPDVIATALPKIETEMQTAAPQSEWTEYCADWFLARYAARVDAANGVGKAT